MKKNNRLKKNEDFFQGKQFLNSKLLHKLITALTVTLLGICGMHGLAGDPKPSANEKKYDWVIFDYGGTLHRKRDNPNGDRKAMQVIYGEIMRDWFKSRGYKVKYSAMELQNFTAQAHKELEARKNIKRPNQKSLLNNIEYYNKWMELIYRQAGVNGYIPLAEREMARLFLLEEYSKRKIKRAPEKTFKILKKLRDSGIRMGVLSNNSGYVEDAVFAMGLREFFEFHEDSARIGLVKPDRRIFDYLEKKYGLAGKRLLYVGDSYRCDVIGCQNAGWDVAWLSEDKKDLPECVFDIKTLNELSDICLK